MKRKFTFLIAAAVMLLTMMATTGEMWGQTRTEEVAYTLQPASGSNNGYANNCDITISGITWNLTGNSQQIPWRIGGKSLDGVDRTLYSKTAISDNITKIEVTHGAASSITINSWTVIVASDANFNSVVSTLTPTFTANSTTTINRPENTDWTGCYYKFVYNVTVSGNSNKFLEFSQAKFYKEVSGDTPSITADDVEIAYDATDGSIEYTLTNGTGNVTAEVTTGDWLTLGTATATEVPFTCSANEAAAARTAQVTLSFTGATDKVVTITQAGDPNAPGTQNNPYTVAQARAAIDAGTGITGVYATGIISQVDSYNSTYSSITYWISSDGTTTSDQLEVYSGKGLNNTNFTAITDVEVGANVVVYGTLKKYGEVYEFDKNNYLTSYTAPIHDVEAPTFAPAAGTYTETQTVTMSCTTDGAAIHYTTDGSEPDGNSDVYTTGIQVSTPTTFKAKAIKGENASPVTTATYHICSAENPYTVAQALAFHEYPTSTIWVHGIVSTAPTAAPNNGQLTYYISDNGEATNQLQVYKGKGLNNAAFTAQDDIQVGDIVTVYGNVVIYGTSNPIKEFASGNYLTSFERPEVPAISVEPATVNATAAETDGTLQVAYTAIASDRGITWYTDQTAATITDEPVWISAEINATTLYVDYTIGANDGAARTAYMKVHGKSAADDVIYSNLVTINQAEYVAPVASITVDPTTVNATAAETDGTLQVTYTNITTVVADIYFCDTNGAAATYDWLDAEINNDNNVYYTIDANTGAARTAYLKVYALDDNAQDVYSELVTINQVAGTTPPTPGQYNWVATDLANLTANDVFVIVGDNGDTYAMSNDNGTSAPTAEAVTIENGAITETVADNIQWNLSTSDDGYMFYPNGTTETWLYCTNTNNGVKVGTGDAKHFTLSDNGYITTSETTDQRYIGIYNSQDWRCYTSEGGNIANQTFAFYKRVPASTEPSITLNQYTYNLNADGGQAELPVVYNNMPANPQAVVIFYESDGVTPLTENPTWITATINGNNNVNGNIQANTGEARSAYFKIKGKDADNHDVYSDLVTINQAAYVLSIVFETTELNIEVGGEQNRVLSFEYQGFGQNPAFEVRQYDATGQTQTTYEWLTTTITQVHKVNITVAANTGAARSGYFKVYGSDGTVNTESNIVTINQAEYVAPTYTVTYNANGGTGTMTDPNSPYTANTEVTLLDNTFTAPEGKIWDSWLVKDANQTTIAVNNNTFTMPASNVTVTAQWVDNPVVPTYEWVLTALKDLTSSDIFVIVGNNGNNYAMANDKGASAPTATAVTIANNKLSDAPANNLKWNISGNATDGYTFYPNGSTTTWLYCIDNNNGLKVGNSSNNTFVIKDNYLYNQGQERYIGIYNSSDWRSYTTINNNIASQTFGFYKRQEATTDPQLYTNDVNIESDATAGEITYTLENEVTGGVLTAAITEGNEGNWLNLGTVGATVPFTCSANTEATARTATVTLTYTYNAKATVTATAVVTQAALIIDYATLPFEYDGNGTGELPTGLTPTGLGTYNASPKMKFDGTGDNLILKLNQAPVSLSYDIKGNSFSGGTFTVQTSANGTNYDDLATYTTLGDAVQSITHVDLNADVRYIKWIYTNKDKGNVALGNIHATEYYDTYGDVTLNDLNLTATSESLIVHSGSVVTVEGELVNNSPDNLVIEDGGQLVFDGDGVMATMKKKTVGESKAEHWYTIASPVNHINFANINNLNNAATFDLYRYDEETYTWENYKNTAHTDFVTAENGRGYLYYNSDGNELSFAGELNNSASYDLTASGAQMNGLNLIGNPFTQDITLANISLSDDAQISEGFYVLSNNSDWVASVTTVKPCEGFIVKVNKATTATFSKSTGSSKSRANRDYIAFTVANNQYEDVAYAMFSNGLGLDKIDHRNAEIPMVYIPQNGQDYAIATMSDDTEMFNLNFKAMTTGQYTLRVDTKGNYSYLHIYDKMTNEDVDMLLEGEYSFIGSPRDAEDRFVVRLSYSATIDGNDTNIFAYQSGSDIIVSGNGELQVFDVMGRMVATMHVNGVQTMSTSSLQTGLYIFRLNEKTQKIVVR